MNTEADKKEILQISELTRQQRRILGVLIEKAYTTSEYYPLTLKATTTGSNQKSNRSPVTSMDEDEVLDVLEELRSIGLVGEVHTDGGRSARYRHYIRHKFEFTEPQIAILAELLLRGKQQLGELRSRASRMVQIASQAELKTELKALMQGGYIQADGPLERRGVQVDHNWYREKEGKTLSGGTTSGDADTTDAPAPAVQTQPAAPGSPSAADDGEVARLRDENAQLLGDMKSLQDEIQELRGEFRQLNDHFDDLKRALGG